MHHLQSFGLHTGMARAEDLDYRRDMSCTELFREPLTSSKRSPTQPDFKHRLTKEPLWMNSRDNPLWVQDELNRCGCAVEQSAADAPLPSLIWACSKNKDLLGGIWLHNELQKRGLDEKYHSDALIAMYAKCGEVHKAQSLLDKHNSSSIFAWNALIASLLREGQGQNAFNYFERMQRESISPNAVTYVCVLKACAAIGAIEKGKRIHNEILRQGLLEHNIVLGCALVDMYAKCGALSQAQTVLEKLPSRNVVSWSALIAGYARKERFQEALECFEQMQRDGIPPDAVTYVYILKVCGVIGAIDKGKQIHDDIVREGLLEHDLLLGNALVDMYAKCGALFQAHSVLEKLPCRDVISWSALIAGYTKKGQYQQALDCFEKMQHEGIPPNAVTFVCILKCCVAIGAIDKGKEIHNEILRRGLLEHDMILANAVVEMYAKCGALPQAQSVLENLHSRNVVMWNALITGYVQEGQGQQALECFKQMQREGIPPNVMTYVCIVKVCALIGTLDEGKKIHEEISRQGFLEHDIILGNALVDMYAKCGAFPQAQSVLEKLPSRDVVSWTALIAGYAQKGHGQQALECFKEMQREGILPNVVTYVCILKACALFGAIDKGKQIHDEVSRQGLLEHSVVLGNALVDMYAKCGALPQAQSAAEKLPSRNVVSWNALIAGYAQKGQGQQALECFVQMQGEGIPPDAVTYVGILKACAVIGAIDKGKKIHKEILRQGLLEHDIVLSGALVDMYAKCGSLSEARSVLEKLPSRNVVLWSALIAGYAHKGQGQQALECFEQMRREGIPPNEVTYVCILKACAVIGAIDKGKQIHDEILRQGLLEHDVVLGNVLVDMYAKCGALLQAQSVLEKLPSRDTVSWNALIAGYAQEGEGEQALKCFERMQCEGILPDIVTFSCLLNVCCHLGLVKKGQELFDDMETKYGLTRDVECFTCMVNLFGRAGHLVKAVEVIQEMPFPANSEILLCLLGACQKWLDVNVGTWAFEQAITLDKCDGAAYALMTNIYSAAGMLEKAKDVEAMRIENKAWKQPGCSLWTGSNNMVDEYCVGV